MPYHVPVTYGLIQKWKKYRNCSSLKRWNYCMLYHEKGPNGLLSRSIVLFMNKLLGISNFYLYFCTTPYPNVCFGETWNKYCRVITIYYFINTTMWWKMTYFCEKGYFGDDVTALQFLPPLCNDYIMTVNSIHALSCPTTISPPLKIHITSQIVNHFIMNLFHFVPKNGEKSSFIHTISILAMKFSGISKV